MGVTIMPEHALKAIIEGCIREERVSQKEFYGLFYGFGYAVCQRYIHTHEEIVENLNDSFLKIYNELLRFEAREQGLENSIKAWIRRIIINTCIDSIRKNKLHKQNISDQEPNFSHLYESETVHANLNYNALIQIINTLSPAYKTVFSLYVLDGFSHEEISKQLGISIGTSKSNLSKARINLQKILESNQYSSHYASKTN